jgi:hypothetical protein
MFVAAEVIYTFGLTKAAQDVFLKWSGGMFFLLYNIDNGND